MTYNSVGQVLTESYVGGSLDGVCISNSYDSLLRRTNLATFNASGILTSTSYGYDSASRLQTVSDGITTRAQANGYLEIR